MATVLPWHSLPTEMKFSVIDQLDLVDVRSFATVDREAYSLTVPAIWRHVDLKSYEALRSYVLNVPPSYHRFIRQLTVCTKSAHGAILTQDDCTTISDALAGLLVQCSQVEQLTLNLECALRETAIASFETLSSLTALTITHCGDEQKQPLSERLVVSMAAAVPNLVDLTFNCIARSAMHAPELIGAYPFVPVVSGDDNIPAHPILGMELSLPSLLRLPSLKKLRIRDTHLGDPRWSTTPVCCSLQVLDLGSCYHESPEFNRICTERIVETVGHTVDEFSLATAISADSFGSAKPQEAPLKRLRKVHLTPLFPVENVVDTLSALSGSPVEQLSVRCHEDDVVDMCSALEDFLNLRVERGQAAFFEHLNEITVDAVADISEPMEFGAPKPVVNIPSEHADAVKHLRDYCRDLRLASPSATNGYACPSGKPATGESFANRATTTSHQ